jgi:hypothetical protein
MIALCLQFLDLNTVNSARLVNKDLNAITRNPSIVHLKSKTWKSCQILRAVREYGKFIKSIDISNNPYATDEIIMLIGAICKNLSYLNIRNCSQISSAALSALVHTKNRREIRFRIEFYGCKNIFFRNYVAFKNPYEDLNLNFFFIMASKNGKIMGEKKLLLDFDLCSTTECEGDHLFGPMCDSCYRSFCGASSFCRRVRVCKECGDSFCEICSKGKYSNSLKRCRRYDEASLFQREMSWSCSKCA